MEEKGKDLARREAKALTEALATALKDIDGLDVTARIGAIEVFKEHLQPHSFLMEQPPAEVNRIVKTVLKALKDSDVRVRRAAVLCLQVAASRTLDIRATVVKMRADHSQLDLEDPNAVKGFGAVTIQRCDVLLSSLRDAETVGGLSTALFCDVDEKVRREVACILMILGPQARGAIPALEAALSDPSGDVRVRAAEALWWVTRHPTTLPALVAELRSKDQVVQAAALDALRYILGWNRRPDGNDLFEPIGKGLPLEKRIRQADFAGVRGEFAVPGRVIFNQGASETDALKAAEGEELVADLTILISQDDPELSTVAARLLNGLPTAPKTVFLKNALKKGTFRDASVLAGALRVLDGLPESARADFLLEAIQAGAIRDATLARIILGRLQVLQTSAQIAFLSDATKDTTVRDANLKVIVSQLTRILAQPDARHSRLAAEQLASLGQAAKKGSDLETALKQQAAPVLSIAAEKPVKSPEEVDARLAARQALKIIDPVIYRKMGLP